jgi:hypothetical protein
MLFVVFVATIERLFGFFSCCERVTYFQVVMTGKTLKQKKKRSKKKKETTLLHLLLSLMLVIIASAKL